MDYETAMQYLAFLDLKMLSEFSELRRLVVFGRGVYMPEGCLVITAPHARGDGDPRIAWNVLLSECVVRLRTLTFRIRDFNDQHAKAATQYGTFEYPYFALQQRGMRLDTFAGTQSLRRSLEMTPQRPFVDAALNRSPPRENVMFNSSFTERTYRSATQSGITQFNGGRIGELKIAVRDYLRLLHTYTFKY
jgi:hypothetical protein